MITMAQAGYNTLLGMGTVFIVLILMSIIIYLLRFIPVALAKLKGKSKEEPASAPAESTQAIEAPIAADLTDDFELVAVIAAAIAASEQVPIDSFVVRTIKRRY